MNLGDTVQPLTGWKIGQKIKVVDEGGVFWNCRLWSNLQGVRKADIRCCKQSSHMRPKWMELWKGLCSVCSQRKDREINLWPSTHSSLSPIMLFQLEEVEGRHHKVSPVPFQQQTENLLWKKSHLLFQYSMFSASLFTLLSKVPPPPVGLKKGNPVTVEQLALLDPTSHQPSSSLNYVCSIVAVRHEIRGRRAQLDFHTPGEMIAPLVRKIIVWSKKLI